MNDKTIIAGALAAAVTIAAFAIGLYFHFSTKIIDHPIEQIAEKVLAQKGIDVDFSKNKKQLEKST